MPRITENELQEQFGKRVQQIREEKGISKTALADILGMERVSLSNIEKGKRNVTLKTVSALAVALQVPVITLFEFDQAAAAKAKKRGEGTKGSAKKKTIKAK